jgi:VIT1/CCC1 family predicted Fe2+/Mn2+ transporter
VSSTDAKAKGPTEFELAFPTKPVQRTDSASTVSSDDEEPEPQAKWYHAAFHICCAIVGTGVLGLPKAFAALSWAGAIVLLLLVFVATYYVSYVAAVLTSVTCSRLSVKKKI